MTCDPIRLSGRAFVAVSFFALARSLAGVSESPAASEPLTVSSNLMVEQEVSVTTRVSGVIDSIQAERGEFVKKGQPLATLDQREFLLDLKAAEETLAVSHADLKRYEELRRLNLTSEAEFEQKHSRYELALVELERAKLVIDRSVVRAPFDGVVADRYARVGEKFLLEESKPLFKVMALEPLLARAYLQASSLQTVRAGDEVTVEAPGFPDALSSGRVSFISPVIDPGSGTVQVIVQVKRDPKRVLRPGMAVKLTFHAAAARR
ncbi:MAG TPA: efflux RND transporter periplasmic adaptor subunit [Thermoanaerobaculia bacterium]|nr:efflux RND transporter periplasmic adaptor subunit [Thermoanaerobaculia bacterium]